ncbi:MAG: CapA family protein [Meiothermus sp.]|nr:CapA family protein [Meiothermus sp.]
MKPTLTVAAVGDVMLNQPFGDGLPLEDLQAADFRVANLEGPITAGGYLADKIAHLVMPPGTAQQVRGLGLDLVALANNHMMDTGPQGIQDTVAELRANGIGHAGAGMNLAEALEPHITEVKGARVATVSLAATVPPGAAAGQARPGIAPLRVRVSYWADGTINEEQPGTPPWVHTEVMEEDLRPALEAVRAARQQADVVLVQMHWGVPPEWNSPFQGDLAEYQRPLAHALVEAGATVILGHHAHALVGIERHGGALIFYSLGNFLLHWYSGLKGLKPQRPAPFFKPRYSERNRQSVIARLRFEQDGGWGLAGVELVPCRLDDNGEARRVWGDKAGEILETLARSDATMGVKLRLRDDGVIELE